MSPARDNKANYAQGGPALKGKKQKKYGKRNINELPSNQSDLPYARRVGAAERKKKKKYEKKK